MFDNVRDANMRLQGTIVRYEGQPIQIHEVVGVDAAIKLVVMGLVDEEVQRLGLDDPELNLDPVPLGYVNEGKGTSYVERIPIRKWKHGLHRENVHIRGDMVELGRDVIRTRYMADTILGVFPTLPEALQSVVEGRRKETAFNRKFSLRMDEETGIVNLMYRTERVGFVMDGKPQLGPKMQYLKEELEAEQ
jgi:hypothetical protein